LKKIFIRFADLFFVQVLTLCSLILFAGGTEPPLLRENEMDYLAVLVRQKPTLYVWEMRLLMEEHLGVVASESTILRSLHKMGITKKKLSKIHSSRFSPHNLVRRLDYFLTIRNFGVDQLLFFDESGFASSEANRPCGWGSQPRVIEVDNYTRTETLQLLALVGLNGVCAFSINEGTTNQFRVAEFFAFKLNKIPQSSVVIMDNASFHHGWVEDVLRNLFSTKNIRLLFLPPYSPDLSPAENFFGMVKFFIKDNRNLYRENRVLAICRAINLLEPRHFVAFF
jgi:transposase